MSEPNDTFARMFIETAVERRDTAEGMRKNLILLLDTVHHNAIESSISVVQQAREEGEGDMRQVINWLRGLQNENS